MLPLDPERERALRDRLREIDAHIPRNRKSKGAAQRPPSQTGQAASGNH
jgi:hypothetical protein